jgi:hypothetical protein
MSKSKVKKHKPKAIQKTFRTEHGYETLWVKDYTGNKYRS